MLILFQLPMKLDTKFVSTLYTDRFSIALFSYLQTLFQFWVELQNFRFLVQGKHLYHCFVMWLQVNIQILPFLMRDCLTSLSLPLSLSLSVYLSIFFSLSRLLSPSHIFHFMENECYNYLSPAFLFAWLSWKCQFSILPPGVSNSRAFSAIYPLR